MIILEISIVVPLLLLVASSGYYYRCPQKVPFSVFPSNEASVEPFLSDKEIKDIAKAMGIISISSLSVVAAIHGSMYAF